ncbi:glycosyltransferase family 4 protein [Desulfobotulus sp. H1]|uniref:Glycosyltransferase family 4 protein n=1 Tax=Desulfobotulus pelophilus TaxID=2823377 RepID=A0ABT3NCX1_9BACT|nr:glycosyltransferase family 4 protein [Desulfobotulus pelophilus]MCW7755320.1 glycosyltransferase family 4 protein [Desulfobotulus pelophilus]
MPYVAAMILLVFLASYVLTRIVRHYAISKSLMDTPCDRSSHETPTPRGGGLAVVIIFVVTLFSMAMAGFNDWSVVAAFSGAGGLVAFIGFWDDRGHIPARWRLLGHFTAAAWGLYWLGGIPDMKVMGHTLHGGWFSGTLILVGLVWLLNLYNFMDGIDGIAGAEAVSVCIGGAFLYYVLGEKGLALIPLVLAAAAAGFLVWNFPVARIFMGDAGSGFIGLILGLLAIQAAWFSPAVFWCWMILLAVFISDATLTLLRRLFYGEKVYEAHRSHAYQYASRLAGNHKTVTLAVVLINLIWLFPLSVAVALEKMDGSAAFLIACLPLALVAFFLKAGAGHLQKK